MFESIINFFKKLGKKEQETTKSKDAAKERLHLVLMQDRANVSADFLDLMKQEIIEVIKKYIDVDENAIDVRLTNKTNGDGTTGAPALYANIPIVSIKEDVRNKIARENDEKAEHIVPDKKEEKIESEPKKEEQKQEKQNEEKVQETDTKSENINLEEKLHETNTENKDIKVEEKKEEAKPEQPEAETIASTEKKNEEENKETPNNDVEEANASTVNDSTEKTKKQ